MVGLVPKPVDGVIEDVSPVDRGWHDVFLYVLSSVRIQAGSSESVGNDPGLLYSFLPCRAERSGKPCLCDKESWMVYPKRSLRQIPFRFEAFKKMTRRTAVGCVLHGVGICIK